MSAYLIAHVNVKDADQWKIYSESVAATREPYGGQLVFHAQRTAVLVGDHDYDALVVLEFPDGDSLNNWYNSPEYQELAKIRKQAADVVFISYET